MRYALLLTLLLTTGCARYEFDLVHPEQRHIGSKPHIWLDVPPITYEMAARDGELVVFVENTSDQTLTLRPDKSYVLDQQGASRSIRPVTIAPKSYVKLIFPPPKPYVRDEGPRFGFGFGAYDGPGHIHSGVGVGTSTGSGTVRGLDENWYWDWNGEGQVKFHLVFSDAKQFYEHDLVIKRVRK